MGAHQLLDAARAVAPELERRALEAEQAGTMPLDVVEKLRGADLMHLALPAELGGPEADPLTIIEVTEELCRADGSAGWTTMINNTSSFAAWLEPEVAKELVAENPRFIAASMFGPSATAEADGDDFVISGRWPFNSGCQHSDYLVNGIMVMDDGKPRLRADGMVDWRFAWIPRAEVEIEDTWQVSGLRGTGSNHTSAHSVRVPVERTIAPLFEPARLGGPMFGLPFPTLLCGLMAGFPLGVARRALDELIALAQSKSRIAGGTGTPMVDDEAVHVELARAEADLRSARAHVVEMVGRAAAVAAAGDEPDIRLRAKTTLSVLNAGRTARSVVDTACSLAGGGAIYETSPLQRCARDIAAGTAHIFFSQSRWKEAGRILMGKEPTTFFI